MEMKERQYEREKEIVREKRDAFKIIILPAEKKAAKSTSITQSQFYKQRAELQQVMFQIQ